MNSFQNFIDRVDSERIIKNLPLSSFYHTLLIEKLTFEPTFNIIFIENNPFFGKTKMTSEWTLFRVNSATEFSLKKKMENDIPEESHLSVPEIIKLHGYSCLELKVTTTDGFQLSVFRVEKPDIIPNGPAVLLQHGLLADAANWISIRVLNINSMNVLRP